MRAKTNWIAGLAIIVAGASAQADRPSAPLIDVYDVTAWQSPAPENAASKQGDLERLTLPSLDPFASKQLEELAAWNRSGRAPQRSGVVRWPTKAVSLDSTSLGKTVEERQVMRLAASVDGGWRLRLGIDVRDLSVDAQLWVTGSGGEEVGPFDSRLADDSGMLWTPSVAGPEITLTVAFDPDHSVSLHVDRVLQLFPLNADGVPVTVPEPLGCIVGGQCIDEGTFSAVDRARRAIGRLEYVDGLFGYLCSGGLINDTDVSSRIPYLLTANHCFDSNNAAASLEVFYDYHPEACGGPIPSLGSRPRSNGGVVRATGADGDYTLVQLLGIPAGRSFLGFNADWQAVQTGRKLHRLAHPNGRPQEYTQTLANRTPSGTCTDLPSASFLYEDLLLGQVEGGSSGAPILLNSGAIVGQLFGSCGRGVGCGFAGFHVDGALAAYFDGVAPFLDPAAPITRDVLVVAVEFRTEPGAGDVVLEPGVEEPVYPLVRYEVRDTSTLANLRKELALDGSRLCSLVSDTAPGTRSMWCTTPVRLSAGPHELSATVDSDNRFVEMDEGNNRFSQSYDVPSDTDIIATGLLLRTAPENGGEVINRPMPGIDLYPHLQYRVDSPRNPTGMKREIFWDGELRCRVTVNPGPGDRVGWCNDPLRMTEGRHRLEGIVDADDDFLETDEDNNRTERFYRYSDMLFSSGFEADD